VLDRTVFYPMGGGQAGDAGAAGAPACWAPMAATHRHCRHPQGQGCRGPVHTSRHLPCARTWAAGWPPLAVGDTVTARIDWQRRHRLMRFHTTTHLLCHLVPQLVNGCSITPDYARLDFNMTDPLDKDALTAGIAALVAAAHPVDVGAITDAELDANPALVKSMSVQPAARQRQHPHHPRIGRTRPDRPAALRRHPCGQHRRDRRRGGDQDREEKRHHPPRGARVSPPDRGRRSGGDPGTLRPAPLPHTVSMIRKPSFRACACWACSRWPQPLSCRGPPWPNSSQAPVVPSSPPTRCAPSCWPMRPRVSARQDGLGRPAADPQARVAHLLEEPGDSGLPTQCCSGPARRRHGRRHRSGRCPKKIPIGTLANYGYEGTVLLPVPLTVTPQFKPGCCPTPDGPARCSLAGVQDRMHSRRGRVHAADPDHRAPRRCRRLRRRRQAQPQTPAAWPATACPTARTVRSDGNTARQRARPAAGAAQGKTLEFFPETPEVIETAAPGPGLGRRRLDGQRAAVAPAQQQPGRDAGGAGARWPPAPTRAGGPSCKVTGHLAPAGSAAPESPALEAALKANAAAGGTAATVRQSAAAVPSSLLGGVGSVPCSAA
jgi:misacylated tRNA(Ala) deacylase